MRSRSGVAGQFHPGGERGTENLSTLEQGMLSTSIAEAAELSRERGQVIEL